MIRTAGPDEKVIAMVFAARRATNIFHDTNFIFANLKCPLMMALIFRFILSPRTIQRILYVCYMAFCFAARTIIS